MRRHLATGVSLFLLAACGDGPVAAGGRAVIPPASSQVATVNVTPLAPLIAPGDTVRLRATTLDVGGTVLAGRFVVWGTESESIATVSQAGLVTAVSPGTVRITAASEGRTGQATVTILAR
jgi:uncharacterized protein YjdB